MESGVVVSVRVKPLDGTSGGGAAAAKRAEEAVAVSNPRTPRSIFVSKPVSGTAAASQDSSALVASTTSDGKMFTFDFVHWSTGHEALDAGHFASQEVVFQDIGIPIVDNAIGGYNCTLFAYGQTGSGKTYTMLGADGPSKTVWMDGGPSPTADAAMSVASTSDSIGSEAGLIPRICRDIMDGSRVPVSPDYQSTSRFEVTYVEIYMERVRDLLAGSGAGSGAGQGIGKQAASNLRIREHPTRGSFVEGARCESVETYEQLLALMRIGNTFRQTASTEMNEHSSRSHAIFTITMTQQRLLSEENRYDVVSKLNLVDLAGSESARLAGTSGERLKEGAAINKSLLTLGRVIKALADRSKRVSHGGEGVAHQGMRTSLIGFEGELNSGSSTGGRSRRSTGDALNRANNASSLKPQRRSGAPSGSSASSKDDASTHAAAGGLAPPYRDSTLTYLLKDSLGGNSKTTLIATVRPGAAYVDETLVTLAYASQARKIVNSVKINENPFVTTIKSLQKQVEELTRNLAMANTIIASKGPPAGPASPETALESELSGPQYMSPFLMEADDENTNTNKEDHCDGDSGGNCSDSSQGDAPTGSNLESTTNQAIADSVQENNTSSPKDEDNVVVVVREINRENSKCTEPEADLFAPNKGGAVEVGDWEEIFKDVSSFSEHDVPRAEAVRTALDDAFPEEEEEGNAEAKGEVVKMKDPGVAEKLRHKAGFLFKRGWVNTAFKLRWCVTKGDSIYYFKRTTDKEPRGKICCLDAVVDLNTEDAQNPDTPFSFSLRTPYDPHHRSWVLQATSLEERDDWVSVIRAIATLPPPGADVRIASVRAEAPTSPSSAQRDGAALVPVSSPNAKLAVAASVCSVS